MMADPAALMKAEPLVMAEYPLTFNLISEVLPAFASSAEAAACPRLRPRKWQRLGGTTSQAVALSFTRWSAACYEVSGAGNATLRPKTGAHGVRMAMRQSAWGT
jgi:hypothetical protein